jgi:hypothetical protein
MSLAHFCSASECPSRRIVGMNRWLLALAVCFLGAAGLAQADCVIIVANLGHKKDQAGGMQGMPGMPGGMAGMPGAMRGMPGGMPGMPGGAAGMPGGAAGMPGAMRGMPGGAAGMPGGAAGMPGGAAGMPGGMRGMPGGMQGMQGMPGAMRGMPGGMPGMGMRGMGVMGAMGMGMAGMPGMGMFGGGMLGNRGIPGLAGADIDDVPFFIIAVVEVKNPSSNSSLHKKIEAKQPIEVRHRWGVSKLLPTTDVTETIFIRGADGKPLPTVADQYAARFKDTVDKNKPTVESLLDLADWTLRHGLVDRFPEVMGKLAEIDKGHPAVVAYTKVKAELDRPIKADSVAAAWKGKLPNGSRYKITETDTHHYAVLHASATDSAAEVKVQLDNLENTLRSYYYFFALKGLALPLPQQRLLAVVPGTEEDLNLLHGLLTSGPMVSDGFFARRENLTVLSSRRLDEQYDALETFSKPFWQDDHFNRKDIITKKGAGHPRGADPNKVAQAQTLALMLAALEYESQLTTISHDGSRQLLYASGLLPRNVAAPEWILFGMGSFFETAPQSPWASPSGENAYYLPRFRELVDNGGFGKSHYEVLRQVVTDHYFRNLPARGAAGSAERRAHDAALRKARAATWALTYFLARDPQHFDGLMRYFKELSKMPRDIELDEEALLVCFARAFGAVDANGKVNKARLESLANNWFAFMANVHFDSENTMKTIRDYFRKKLKENEDALKSNAGQVQPGFQGGFPQPGMGGAVPPGGVVPPQGGFPPRQ